jgi:hypothetical protein
VPGNLELIWLQARCIRNNVFSWIKVLVSLLSVKPVRDLYFLSLTFTLQPYSCLLTCIHALDLEDTVWGASQFNRNSQEAPAENQNLSTSAELINC